MKISVSYINATTLLNLQIFCLIVKYQTNILIIIILKIATDTSAPLLLKLSFL